MVCVVDLVRVTKLDSTGVHEVKIPEFKVAVRLPGSLLFLVLVLPLALYARIGFHTRYMADDFWTAGYLRTLGFWEAQRYWYVSWSGRFSFTFLVSLVESMGVSAITWLPLFAIVIWFMGLYWFFGELFKLARLPFHVVFRLVAAALTLYVTLRSLEYWHQVILWQTGILTYILPLIAFSYWMAWFLHRLNRTETLSASVSQIFLTVIWFWFFGGLSETSLAMVMTLLTLAILSFRLFNSASQYRHQAQFLLGAALVGSFLALIFMGIAPGNAVRAREMERAGLWDLLSGSFNIARYYIQRWVFNHIRPAAFAFVVPAIAAFFLHPPLSIRADRKIELRTVFFVLLLPLMALAIYWSCFVPAYFVMSSGPPHRAMVVPQFVITMSALTGSYLGGVVAKRFLNPLSASWFVRICSVIILIGLVCAGPLQATWKLGQDLAQFKQFSIEWDIRDQILREAQASGTRHVIVPRVRDLYMIGEVTPLKDAWINQAVARYYGVETVVISGDP